MKTVDTNVLVYAHRAEFRQHAVARERLRGLAEGGEPWGLPWPCVYEFLRVVTHPRVLRPPTPLWQAWESVLALITAPATILLGPTGRHAAVVAGLLQDSTLRGNDLFDVQIAALAIEHDASVLVTGDRRFRRFDGIRVEDPFRAG